MIICPRCSKDNQDHFKFCLGCGAQLPKPASPVLKPASKPAPFSNPKPSIKPAPVSTAKMRPAAAQAKATLVAILPDGSDGERFAITADQTIGRDVGGLFASDTYLSPKHARFRSDGKAFKVSDEKSYNGVFLRVVPETPCVLTDGTIFRIGQELIRFEKVKSKAPGSDGVLLMGSPAATYVGRIVLLTGKTATGNAYVVSSEGLQLGRERGDIIFPDDGYVSGLHCKIHSDTKNVYLTDLGSSNGTFVRIEKETELADGSCLLMGQQLYRVDLAV